MRKKGRVTPSSEHLRKGKVFIGDLLLACPHTHATIRGVHHSMHKMTVDTHVKNVHWQLFSMSLLGLLLWAFFFWNLRSNVPPDWVWSALPWPHTSKAWSSNPLSHYIPKLLLKISKLAFKTKLVLVWRFLQQWKKPRKLRMMPRKEMIKTCYSHTRELQKDAKTDKFMFDKWLEVQGSHKFCACFVLRILHKNRKSQNSHYWKQWKCSLVLAPVDFLTFSIKIFGVYSLENRVWAVHSVRHGHWGRVLGSLGLHRTY